MPTHEEQLARIRRTPQEIAALIEDVPDVVLTRRPAPDAWGATEVICHLRDTEESFMARFHLALQNDNPRWPPAGSADRWAEDRQYIRNDGRLALAAFARRRAEQAALLDSMTEAQWSRTGIHPTRGRITLREVLALEAGHDDNHLEQLRRALRGEP